MVIPINAIETTAFPGFLNPVAGAFAHGPQVDDGDLRESHRLCCSQRSWGDVYACIYVCMYEYMYTYIYLYMYIHICIYIYNYVLYISIEPKMWTFRRVSSPLSLEALAWAAWQTIFFRRSRKNERGRMGLENRDFSNLKDQNRGYGQLGFNGIYIYICTYVYLAGYNDYNDDIMVFSWLFRRNFMWKRRWTTVDR